MPAPTTRRRLVAAALAAPLAAALGTARAQNATPVPPATPGAAQGEELVAQLTRIAENVYVFRSMNHQTLFIVTPEGVIAADPIGQTNPQAPELYRAAIAASLLRRHGRDDVLNLAGGLSEWSRAGLPVERHREE